MALFKKKPKKGEGDPPPEGAEDAAAAAPAEGAEGEVQAEAPKKGLPLKMMIIAAAGVLVLGGAGGGAYMMFGPKAPPDAHKKAKDKKKKDEKTGKEGDKNAPQIADGPDGVVFYTLPDIVVNMQTADGKPTFLKLKLTLELPDHDTVDVLEPNRPRLQDMFETFLRELRPEDLAGSQGSYQLRMEILRRVNLVIAPAKINAVLIEEMLIN
jgi:flagellar FliL protein